MVTLYQVAKVMVSQDYLWSSKEMSANSSYALKCATKIVQ